LGNYEIIIIDNSSDIEVFEEVKAYLDNIKLNANSRIKLFRCFSHSNSWNIGLLKSEADWVIMLHDDDLLSKNHLSDVENVIRLNSNIKVLCSDSFNLIETNQLSFLTKFFLSVKELMKSIRKDRLIKLSVFDFYFHNPAPNTGVVLNRESAIDAGGFNRKDDPIPDYAFFYRLTREFDNTYYLNKKLSTIRFSVNDGLKSDVIFKVKKSSDKIREDIKNYNKFYDFGYAKYMSELTDLDILGYQSVKKKYFKKSILTIYTRFVSLIIFAKSLIFQ
jgi:glycosyltransferase involved in cell wall biosynthesis